MVDYMVFALALFSLFTSTESESVTVNLEADPPVIGPNDHQVALVCSYDAEENGWTVNTVDWIGPQATQILNWGPSKEPSENRPLHNYVGRVQQYSEVTNRSHSMVLTGVSWCKDLGPYDCYVGVDNVNVRAENALIDVKAHKEPGQMVVNGAAFDKDTEVISTSGKVSCSAVWYSEDVTVILMEGDRIVNGTGSLTGRDNCTCKTEAILEYKFEEPGSLTFTCTAYYEGEAMEPATFDLKYDGPFSTENSAGCFCPVYSLLLLVICISLMKGN